MHVSRIGLAALKGARHRTLPHVDLTADGPVGDRDFCLIDVASGKVLKTIQNIALLRTVAAWDGDTLAVTFPSDAGQLGGRVVSGRPIPASPPLTFDYWGRPAALELVDGPWSDAFSAYLQRDVRLARARTPGALVYGASVSLITTSALSHLGERLGKQLGAAVDEARFRATFTIDTNGLPADVEDAWLGRRLRLGEAEVRINAPIARCAVIDADPVIGDPGPAILKALAIYRNRPGGIDFGLDATVVRPGRITTGDLVTVLDEPSR